MSKTVFKYVFFSYTFLSIVTGYAQQLSGDLKFENISIDKGLSSSSINSIIQDSKGFLWIGTEDGLNRFDGYSFKVFRNKRGDKNSLSNNFIWSLFEDKSGNIWIGTDGGGLNKYDPATDKFERFVHDQDNKNSISSDAVQCVYQDKQENLWAGTWGRGLNLYDSKSKSFVSFRNNPEDKSSLSNDKVFCVFEDDQNNLWIGTDGGGLNLFDRKTKNFKSFNTNNSSLVSNSITTIFQTSPSELWLGTTEGYLINFNSKDFSSRTFNLSHSANSSIQNNIWKIERDSQGLIWIATIQEGLFIFNPATETYVNVKSGPKSYPGLESQNLKYLYRDRSDNLWIGTMASGLYKVKRQKSNFNTINKLNTLGKLKDEFVFCLSEDKEGNIWIGTMSGGAFRFNPKRSSIKNYPPNSLPKGLSGEIIRYVYNDRSNNLWIGPYYGSPNIYNFKNDSFEQFDLDFNKDNPDANLVRVIFEDSEGILWFGLNGNGGVVTYDRKTGKFERYSTSSTAVSKISGDEILSICEDKNGFIWLGTYSYGLNRFDKKNSTFRYYKRDENNLNSLPGNIIPELFIDSDGNLWVGTYSDGLCKYNYDTDNFKIYTEDDGLIDNSIFGIVEDNDRNLWISTSKGISKFNKTENTFTNFDQSLGVQKGDFNPSARCKTKDGWIYFGGVNGVTYFHPDSIDIEMKDEVPVLTSFKIFNEETFLPKSVAYIDTIILNHNDNFFSFEFTLPEFSAPDKIQYSYIMEGLEEEWIKIGNRGFVNFTHLDPGKYLFKVRSSNVLGVWSNSYKQIVVIINPPFWLTWWFRILTTFIVIGVLVFIYKKRTRQLKKEKRIQIEFSKQLIQSQEEERKRIASELHDSLGQDLLVIKNIALLNKMNDEHFEEISKTAGLAIDEVRRISYNLHPYQLDRLGLTKAIGSMFQNIEGASNIKFDVYIDNVDNLFDKEKEINIYRIVQECVNNIVKHSASTESTVSVKQIDNQLCINISDNGNGFDYEIMKFESKGFGLKNLENRVSFMGGKLEFKSDKEFKTQIMINLPVSK